MNTIHRLDQKTIEQIAAGEVIQSPYSIIKEGIENAIDAESTSIVIEIENGGLDFVRISDNGNGISREDLSNAFKKHYTSKIHVWEDMYALQSCGFRGEALNAISQVSNATLISKQNENAYMIQNDFGKQSTIRPTVANKGTTLITENLFQNMPVRKKFLSSPRHEENRIKNIVSRFSIGYPNISFRLVTNGREVINTSGAGLKQAIFEVFGKNIASNLISIDSKKETHILHGYIVKPYETRSSSIGQMLFVNNRIIEDTTLRRRIEGAYKPFISTYRKPIYFLFLEVPSDEIDVNIHPSKETASFHHHDEICDAVYADVANALSNVDHIEIPKETYDVEFLELEEDTVLLEEDIPEYLDIEKASEGASRADHETHAETHLQFSLPFEGELPRIQVDIHENGEDQHINQRYNIHAIFPERNMWNVNRIIGPLFKRYMLLENRPHGLFIIIDLRSASESVLYDQLVPDENGEVSQQILLEPILYDIDHCEFNLLDEKLMEINQMGFDLSLVSENSIILRAIPMALSDSFEREMMYDILHELFEERKPNLAQEKIRRRISGIISHGRNDYSDIDFHVLLNNLLQSKNNMVSPTGKQIFYMYTTEKFEKDILS